MIMIKDTNLTIFNGYGFTKSMPIVGKKLKLCVITIINLIYNLSRPICGSPLDFVETIAHNLYYYIYTRVLLCGSPSRGSPRWMLIDQCGFIHFLSKKNECKKSGFSLWIQSGKKVKNNNYIDKTQT